MARMRHFPDPIESHAQRQARLPDQTNYDVPAKPATPEQLDQLAKDLKAIMDEEDRANAHLP